MDNKPISNTSSKLIDLIVDICKRVIKKETARIPKEWVGTVSSSTPSVAPNAYADIYINGDTTQPVINVKNKSWETIVTGDGVYLHSPTGKLSNIIVLYKK